jgi:hypothetical protein
MRSPFPGMDPYLEHPALWPDVHNSLIAAIRDALAPLVAPRYYVGLERRTYLLSPDDLVFVGRSDVSVLSQPAGFAEPVMTAEYEARPSTPAWVEVPVSDEIGEGFLEIRAVDTRAVITVLELLSPANKLHDKGREQYLDKRRAIMSTRTNLVEVDLLRAGEPMPMRGNALRRSDYRILISRSWQRPRAQLYSFSLRDAIPRCTVPLQRGEEEPALDLNAIVHDLYARARYDLELNYRRLPVPPLSDEDAAWAEPLIASARSSTG